MDKKFLVKIEQTEDKSYPEVYVPNGNQLTNDHLVNDFLEKKFSLESLIEKEIYHT